MFARQGTPSPQEGVYGVCCGMSLLCQPALHFNLLSHNWGKGLHNPHSLSNNVPIDPRPRDGQPRCEVQGEVDQKVFVSCDFGKGKTNPLGEEVKSMNAWEAQTDTLRDTGDLLKGQMPDVTPEKHTDKGPLPLQARMTCWREDNGLTNASWEFGFNGQLCLVFDSENGHCTMNGFWTMVHSKGRQMKQKWGNDRGVTDFFRTVSMGDCQAWLRDFMVCWEKMLKTSGTCPGRTVARGCSVILFPLSPPGISPHSTGLCTIEHGFSLILNMRASL
uniref:MHC class I-like antigen recognition-like domain-containing protein n=1 Tax=Capra hircus TaxID=9925 RepID=A0A8C2XZ16_CAPHI